MIDRETPNVHAQLLISLLHCYRLCSSRRLSASCEKFNCLRRRCRKPPSGATLGTIEGHERNLKTAPGEWSTPMLLCFPMKTTGIYIRAETVHELHYSSETWLYTGQSTECLGDNGNEITAGITTSPSISSIQRVNCGCFEEQSIYSTRMRS